MVAQRSAPATTSRRSDAQAARSEANRTRATIDAELVRRFNAGDESAFAEIVEYYRDTMFHIAFRQLRNHADAEEIAQDTFIRAHRSLARFRGDSSLAAWLYRVTLNLTYNRRAYFFRRRRHVSFSLDAAFKEDGTSTLAEVIACASPGPVRETVCSELAAIIGRCTEELAAAHQEILALRTAEHRSYSYIGRRLGISIGTVKSRIARARTKLRARLSEACPEFNPDDSPFAYFEPTRSSGSVAAISA